MNTYAMNTDAKKIGDALDAAYQNALLRDDIQAFESLRRVAYNDIVEEMGCLPETGYALSGWQQFIRSIA